MSGKPISEFVGLRSKLYSFKGKIHDEEEKKVCKGIKKSVVKNRLTFDNFKECVFSSEIKMVECNTLRSYHHEMYSISVNKVALSAFDEKRYLVDKLETLPYGHFLAI